MRIQGDASRMPGRLVDLPPGNPLDPLAQYLRHAAATGHWVLLTTARLPGLQLLEQLPRLGVDLQHLVILDATAAPGAISPDPDHLQYVPSMALLELLTLRGEKTVWRRRRERTRLATFDLNSFARVNSPDALEQIVRYTLGRVKPYTFVDYFLSPAPPIDPLLMSALEHLCPTRLPLADLLESKT